MLPGVNECCAPIEFGAVISEKCQHALLFVISAINRTSGSSVLQCSDLVIVSE